MLVQIPSRVMKGKTWSLTLFVAFVSNWWVLMFWNCVFFICVLQELRGYAAASEGAVSLPAWSGRRHEVPLLQSNCHLCCTCSLPQRLPLCLSCTACTVPGCVSVFAVISLLVLQHMQLCCLFKVNGWRIKWYVYVWQVWMHWVWGRGSL